MLFIYDVASKLCAYNVQDRQDAAAAAAAATLAQYQVQWGLLTSYQYISAIIGTGSSQI